MTDHQHARRARKAKAFFARLAEQAALTGDRSEAIRLRTVALRKQTAERFALALMDPPQLKAA